MTSYQYIKAKPKRLRKMPVWISFAMMSFGLMMLLWVVWPIISFNLASNNLYSQSIISPITAGSFSAKSVLGKSDTNGLVQATGLKANNDLTNANDWYPNAPQKKINSVVNSYTVSIPKLKIENALVLIAGDDLNQSLIHYGGTGLPGDYGTAVIFGHSALPQFYNPKNYHSVFSLLPTLKINDDIWITYDKVTYHYVVEEMTVTEPTDLSPLTQKFDDSHVTLVTCVPPGTEWKRLNVRARLVHI